MTAALMPTPVAVILIAFLLVVIVGLVGSIVYEVVQGIRRR